MIILSLLSIVFIATLVRSTFGFGESLVAVPLLIMLIPIEVAVPLSVLLSVFIAAIILVQDRTQIHFHSAKWLVIFATMGIPIGLGLLIYGDEKWIKLGLGIIIISYSVYSLTSKRNFRLESDDKIWLFFSGFLSGVLGGAYGLNGPPLVVYGSLRNWSSQHFRATLQAYFLPVSTIGMIGYAYNDLWTGTVTYYFLISIPVVVPAVFLGRYLNRQLEAGAFLNYLHVGLIAIGLLLLTLSLKE